MAQHTSIEWVRNYNADGTFTEGYTVNPVRFKPFGSERTVTMCQHASPGCTHCYSEAINRRFWPKDASTPFPGFTAKGLASGEFVLDMKQLLSVLKIKKPAKIFWGDMTDLFQKGVTDEMLDACFAICALTPHITHMFLTKRPERMVEYFTKIRDEGTTSGYIAAAFGRPARFFPQAFNSLPLNNSAVMPWPLPNVMLGTSCENQKYFNERVPVISQLHKWNLFLSLEPLIGPIDVEYPKELYPDGPPMCCSGIDCGCHGLPVEPPMIHSFFGFKLIIVGGESGPGARPMLSHWAGNIQEACARWKTPFFFKQVGMFVDAGHEEFGRLPKGEIKALRSDGTEWDLSDMPEDENADVNTVKRVGRKRAGDTLYGKVYHEYPNMEVLGCQQEG